MRSPRRFIVPLLFLMALLATRVAEGRINVVSLPGRDSVQLTIYNSVDLTLVRETRVLTLHHGINRLEFSWANTLIDPTSVEFRPLTHADEVEVLDVSYPPRVTNTLEWRIRSEFAGEAQVEIRYFTSGISWAADYVVEAARSERQMDLKGYVRVTNQSGEDYENAQVRLIVGVIRLVEDIANLAKAGRPGPVSQPGVAGGRMERDSRRSLMRGMAVAVDKVERLGRQQEITKEGISEYFMYTVAGRDTIPTGWSKRLPSLTATAIPLVSYYKFEQERWANQVMRYYRFKNDKTSNLGKEPLPDGTLKAFRLVSDDRRYAFVGGTDVKYIPVDEQVELELGADQEVLVKPTLLNWEKTDLRFDAHGDIKGWTVKETWQVELRNSKDIPVTVDIRRNFAGDWALASETASEKVDATKIKWVFALKPHETRTVGYTLTTRFGSNATR